MNPDYRYLGEESRHHRWNLPGSPIVETFTNGRPLQLFSPPSRVQQARLSQRRSNPIANRVRLVCDVPDRRICQWSESEITSLILLAQVFPLHIIGDRLKKKLADIQEKAREIGLALTPMTTGWSVKQLSCLLGVAESTVGKWIEMGTLVALPDRLTRRRYHVSRDALIAFIDARRYRNATLMQVDHKVIDWILSLD
jgi:hypothetical protein